jgi:hypothetical protein
MPRRQGGRSGYGSRLTGRRLADERGKRAADRQADRGRQADRQKTGDFAEAGRQSADK